MSNSAFRDGRSPIELGGQTRYMCFSLNAMVDVEERFGGVEKLPEAFEGPTRLKNIRWLLTLLLNEGREEDSPELSEREVGRMINGANLKDVTHAIFASMRRANNGDEPVSEEPDSGEA
jgi:hypothetical protein